MFSFDLLIKGFALDKCPRHMNNVIASYIKKRE